jgi:hypothetical protein
MNYIWVAASARSTIIKIETTTGEIKGEYYSAPTSQGPGNPSRTTVDSDGSVWVSNRDFVPGTIIHIGLEENGQCEDRNNNGIIDTSTGLGDIRAWSDPDGIRGVEFAEDECIVHYVTVSSIGTRHLSVDFDNNVWASGSNSSSWDLVKGGRYDVQGSGNILQQYNSVNYGGYGGIFAPNGYIWSARPLLFWNPDLPLTGPNGATSADSVGPLAAGFAWGGIDADTYGICLDPYGYVWITQFQGNAIRKYTADGIFLATFSHGYDYAQGCVVDLNGDIWVAHDGGQTTIGHLKNDGTFVGNVDTLEQYTPTGVAVDRNGKIWSTNRDSNSVTRIDPSLNNGIGAVDLIVNVGEGASPYNYGDMTGSTLSAAPTSGSWMVVHDSGVADQLWSCISWEDKTPGDSEVLVFGRTSTDPNNFTGPWIPIQKGIDPQLPRGQYLQVRVQLRRATKKRKRSPILYSLTLLC